MPRKMRAKYKPALTDWPFPYGEDPSRLRPFDSRNVEIWTEPRTMIEMEELEEQMELIHEKDLPDMNLSYSHLGPQGFTEMIMPILASQTAQSSVRNLCLTYNHLGDEGVKLVAQALTRHPTIEKVWLFNNGITDAGGETILNLLKTTPRLKVVGVAHNVTMSKEMELEIFKQCNRNQGLPEDGKKPRRSRAEKAKDAAGAAEEKKGANGHHGVVTPGGPPPPAGI